MVTTAEAVGELVGVAYRLHGGTGDAGSKILRPRKTRKGRKGMRKTYCDLCDTELKKPIEAVPKQRVIKMARGDVRIAIVAEFTKAGVSDICYRCAFNMIVDHMEPTERPDEVKE